MSKQEMIQAVLLLARQVTLHSSQAVFEMVGVRVFGVECSPEERDYNCLKIFIWLSMVAVTRFDIAFDEYMSLVPPDEWEPFHGNPTGISRQTRQKATAMEILWKVWVC